MSLNEEYKKKHKPQKPGSTHYHQGYFTPRLNPQKCLTLGQCIFRSGLEFKFFTLFDSSPIILRWAAEPVSVSYFDPSANFKHCIENHLDWKNPVYWKKREYNIDVWVEILTIHNTVKKLLIEIKPEAETVCPKQPPADAPVKQHRAFNKAFLTYLTNNAKWDAAEKYCENMKLQGIDIDFIVLTEKSIIKCGGESKILLDNRRKKVQLKF